MQDNPIIEFGDLNRILATKLPNENGVIFLTPSYSFEKMRGVFAGYQLMIELLHLLTSKDPGTILPEVNCYNAFTENGTISLDLTQSKKLTAWFRYVRPAPGQKESHDPLTSQIATNILHLCNNNNNNSSLLAERLSACERRAKGFIKALAQQFHAEYSTGRDATAFAGWIYEQYLTILQNIAAGMNTKKLIWQNTGWGKEFMRCMRQVLGEKTRNENLFPDIYHANRILKIDELAEDVLNNFISCIVAEPDMGKTHLAFHLGEKAADREYQVFYTSLAGLSRNDISLTIKEWADSSANTVIILDDVNQAGLSTKDLLKTIRLFSSKAIHFVLLEQTTDLTKSYEDSLRRKSTMVYILEPLSRTRITTNLGASVRVNDELLPIISIPAYLSTYIDKKKLLPDKPIDLISEILKNKLTPYETDDKQKYYTALDNAQTMTLDAYINGNDFIAAGDQKQLLYGIGLLAYSGVFAHDFFYHYFLARELKKRLCDQYAEKTDYIYLLKRPLPEETIGYLGYLTSLHDSSPLIPNTVNALRDIKPEKDDISVTDLQNATANLLYIDAAGHNGEVTIDPAKLDLSATKLYKLRFRKKDFSDAVFTTTNLLAQDTHRTVVYKLLPLDDRLVLSMGKKYTRLWELSKEGKLRYKASFDLLTDEEESYLVPDSNDSRSKRVILSNKAPEKHPDGKDMMLGRHKIQIISGLFRLDEEEIKISNFSVQDACLLKNGRFCVIATNDRSIYLMNTDTKQIVQKIPGSNAGIRKLIKAKDGIILAVSYDGTAIILDKNLHATERIPLGEWPWQMIPLFDSMWAIACMGSTIIGKINQKKFNVIAKIPILMQHGKDDPKVWDLAYDSQNKHLWICERNCIHVIDSDWNKINAYELPDCSPKCILMQENGPIFGTDNGRILRIVDDKPVFSNVELRFTNIQRLVSLGNGNVLVVGNHNEGPKGYTVLNSSDQVLSQSEGLDRTGSQSFGTAAAFDPDTKTGVLGCSNGLIRLFTFEDEKLTFTRDIEISETKTYICDCAIINDCILFGCLGGKLYRMPLDGKSTPELVFENAVGFDIIGCKFTENSMKGIDSFSESLLGYFSNTLA